MAGSQEQNKPSGASFSTERGKGRQLSPASLRGLTKAGTSHSVQSWESAWLNNQTLDSSLQNTRFQINYLWSRITRKPQSLNLNIKDSVVSFESQKWTHFGTGSRDCFSTLLRNERTTSACGPASARPIMSFLLASMIINRCAMNHFLEGAPSQTHGRPLEGAIHQNESREFRGHIHCFEERSLQPRPSGVWSEWVVPSIITSTSKTCPHQPARS